MTGLRRRRLLLFLRSAAAAALVSASVAGCKTTSSSATTGSIRTAADHGAEPDAPSRRDLDAAGARYRANPRDSAAAINYAQALRSIGQRAQAAAVLEQASIENPKNRAVLGAYGRALADAGNYEQAFDILSRAHTPDQPDWRILSVQGAVLDQMGRHDEARRYYASALKLAPDEASVLSNLALSYALSKELAQAETTLRRAVMKNPNSQRIRQNLALVVGLQGRFEEAESMAKADLPPDQAAANVAYLKDMLARHPARRQKPPFVAQGS